MRSETVRHTHQVEKSLMPPPVAGEGTISRRSLVLGGLGALAIGLGGPWVDHALRGSYMTLDFSTPGAIFLLFALAALVQTVLWKMRSRFRLTAAEIITVYSMMIIASAICTQGLIAYLIPLPTGPFYYASPENRWASVLLADYPQWAGPTGSAVGAPVIRYLYEGLPYGRAIPWMAWLPMVAAWAPLVLALYLVMIAMMVIIRRQWVENERLTYSLTQLPLELAGAGSGGFAAILANKVFWLGMALPVVFGVLKGLHFYFPGVPTLNQSFGLSVFRQQVSLQFELSWALLGFFYMVTREATLSLWFFNRLYFTVGGILGILGIKGAEVMGVAGGSKEPYFIHLGTGAFVALVIASLWVGRGHLRHVWEAVRGRADGPVEAGAGEIMSFRAAFWTIVVGLMFMGWWLVQSGLSVVAAVLMLALAFIFFVGITRVVAECGFAAATSPKDAPNMVISWLGSANMGPSGVIAAGLAHVWCTDNRNFVMCSVANSLKAADVVHSKRHLMLWAYLIAIVVAFASSFWLTLHRAYTQGGVTMNAWYFNHGVNFTYEYLAEKANNPKGPAWYGLGLAAAGALAYQALALMRFRYPSWPFHPVGFAIGSVWMMDSIWFTCFLSWLTKSLILRYGGNRLYTFLRPAFLGLICGQFTINALWLVVDQITGTTGNKVLWI